jgi:hypothetical protein
MLLGPANDPNGNTPRGHAALVNALGGAPDVEV